MEGLLTILLLLLYKSKSEHQDEYNQNLWTHSRTLKIVDRVHRSKLFPFICSHHPLASEVRFVCHQNSCKLKHAQHKIGTADFSCVQIFRGSVWFVRGIGNKPNLWHGQTIRFRWKVRTQVKFTVLVDHRPAAYIGSQV